ncbi:hypothetical protein H1235_04125 [Pseudoxanthomonas sp. NC8]|nr:hypothetical protein H1235_04125 [Pseudoxanthomonas sp. NC8]
MFEDGLRMHWLEVPARGPATPAARPAPARVEVVWDASLSMQDMDRGAELELLSRYLAGHPVEVTLTILRETVQQRRLRITTPAQLDAFLATLAAERADGATALAGWRADPAAQRVLLFSDAVATLPGQVEPAAAAPVFVVGRRVADPAMARWLVRSGGQVLDLGRAVARAGPRPAAAGTGAAGQAGAARCELACRAAGRRWRRAARLPCRRVPGQDPRAGAGTCAGRRRHRRAQASGHAVACLWHGGVLVHQLAGRRPRSPARTQSPGAGSAGRTFRRGQPPYQPAGAGER